MATKAIRKSLGIRDIPTTIRCPNDSCGNFVMHRYNCQCDDYWGYCKKTSPQCDFFFCLVCQEESKVSYADEERVEPVSRRTFADFTDDEKSCFNLTLSAEDLTEKLQIDKNERIALQEMFDRIRTPA
jgi:hypothetical protein